MALTSRGKALVAGGAVVAVLGGGIAALALSGNAPESVARGLVDAALPGDQTPSTPCPLTGETLPGDKEPPDRPVLAVKVENTPDAQPLAGLEGADIVYEEVVEGGITRFVALFHCDDANRVGPVRSIRTTDVSVLAPLDTPLFGFAGGSNAVKKSSPIQMSWISTTSMLPSSTSAIPLVAPHNLFTTTKALSKAAKTARRLRLASVRLQRRPARRRAGRRVGPTRVLGPRDRRLGMGPRRAGVDPLPRVRGPHARQRRPCRRTTSSFFTSRSKTVKRSWTWPDTPHPRSRSPATGRRGCSATVESSSRAGCVTENRISLGWRRRTATRSS